MNLDKLTYDQLVCNLRNKWRFKKSRAWVGSALICHIFGFCFWWFRDFAQDSRTLCTGVFDAVLGSVHGIYLCLQHCDEGGIHCEFSSNCLVHEDAPSCAAFVWQRTWHFSALLSCCCVFCVGSDFKREVYISRGEIVKFAVFVSCLRGWFFCEVWTVNIYESLILWLIQFFPFPRKCIGRVGPVVVLGEELFWPPSPCWQFPFYSMLISLSCDKFLKFYS